MYYQETHILGFIYEELSIKKKKKMKIEKRDITFLLILLSK